jgi:hypothetical protein
MSRFYGWTKAQPYVGFIPSDITSIDELSDWAEAQP